MKCDATECRDDARAGDHDQERKRQLEEHDPERADVNEPVKPSKAGPK